MLEQHLTNTGANDKFMFGIIMKFFEIISFVLTDFGHIMKIRDLTVFIQVSYNSLKRYRVIIITWLSLFIKQTKLDLRLLK